MLFYCIKEYLGMQLADFVKYCLALSLASTSLTVLAPIPNEGSSETKCIDELFTRESIDKEKFRKAVRKRVNYGRYEKGTGSRIGKCNASSKQTLHRQW